jgi:Tfp pilus assembly protein PilV
MIVLVILAIGILALSGVQTRSTRDVYSTGRHTRALAVAQARMEVAKTAGFNLAVSDSGVSDNFNWRTLVDSIGPGLDRVRVRVTWTDRGTPRQLELNNLLSRR